MRILNIEPTIKSPKIIFDPKNFIFEMEGSSRPENVRDFYYPIIETLKRFYESIIENDELEKFSSRVFKYNFKLEYFNSSSAKFISDILLIIDKYNKKGFINKIYWYFEDRDDDMIEVGEDFSELINVPFNFVMIKK
jgi:hypothetical protein